jgi:hypothetical protein
MGCAKGERPNPGHLDGTLDSLGDARLGIQLAEAPAKLFSPSLVTLSARSAGIRKSRHTCMRCVVFHAHLLLASSEIATAGIGTAFRKCFLAAAWNVAHAVQYIVIGRLNLRCRPRLQHRDFRISGIIRDQKSGFVASGIGTSP